MHPRYKTKYFIKSNWEDEWIKEAVELARNAWVKRYRECGSAADVPTATVVDTSHSVSFSFLSPLEIAYHQINTSDSSRISMMMTARKSMHLKPISRPTQSSAAMGSHIGQHFAKQDPLRNRGSHRWG